MKRIKTYKIITVGLVLLTLQSCFVAKDYSRPETIVEAEYYRTDQLPQDSLSMASVSWKEMFTDSQLQNYIEEGLQNNIDIRVAIEQISIAEAYVKQGKAGYFPTLTGNATYTRQELSENSQFGNQFSSLDQYQLSGALSWEADIWGKIRSNKRAFQASYLQTVAAHKAVKSRLVANIASTYYQLLALDEQIKITEETIKTRNNSLETTQALKEAGNVTEVGVKQTEAQLYTAQAILIDLKNEARLLENTMSILLGSPMKEISRSTLESQEITAQLKTGVPSQLLRNRPDVIAAEYNFINAFELTNVARSNFYPSFTLSASSGLQSLDIDDLFSASSLFATITGGLTQPIFNGRKIKTQYEVSQAQQEQARLDFKFTILNASKEVSDAMYSYEAASEKIQVKEKEFEAYSLSTDYSEELLDNGLANYLEVLRARENALNSSLDLVNAKNSQLQAIVDFYQALGGGWQ
ncbi:efflux transporter outer membrane subunit [Marixanthomonas sp. SCSIO 43207]|uniref:efflux transporter outer membrane subunit n=1 Tax=Marixanthomonas sp. SCSIO 43207 TaxID=2779360 RepID=UPI001CA886F9|nr:efflux transporter outer membrane subunit [Marixanthomonas sp. SCSIO 43207]UAB82013.1 efflux transporter outer membrane subunit [Marixanthomonas sp. SCSIO 43207]